MEKKPFENNRRQSHTDYRKEQLCRANFSEMYNLICLVIFTSWFQYGSCRDEDKIMKGIFVTFHIPMHQNEAIYSQFFTCVSVCRKSFSLPHRILSVVSTPSKFRTTSVSRRISSSAPGSSNGPVETTTKGKVQSATRFSALRYPIMCRCEKLRTI